MAIVSLSSPALAAVVYCFAIAALAFWCCMSFRIALAPPPKVEVVLNLEL